VVFFRVKKWDDSYVGIDWSGDKSNFQKGISVSQYVKGTKVPPTIKPKKNYGLELTYLNG